MKRKSIAVTLIAVLICVSLGTIVACTPTSTPTTEYALIINSTEGGSVTAPGEGTFTYDEAAVVNLVAEAEQGYHFVNWTGDVGSLGDVNDAATTITMNNEYSVTANFAAVYDLTIASTAGGSVTTPGEGAFLYDEGTVVDLVAEADGGYQFVNWAGDVGTIANVDAAITTITVNDNYWITANFQYTPMVAAGYLHTVGLRSDGAVVAVGYNLSGQCNVGGWTDIVRVAAGYAQTVGLRSDGTVVAVGYNFYGQCDVGGWTDIAQVTTGFCHTVGLKSDGTVVAVGDNSFGQCDVGGWTDIAQVTAGYEHTVGLKSDGTVVPVGDNFFGQCDVGGWTGIIQVAAGGYHTVGLKSDGTVVAVGGNYYGQCDVGGWTDIAQVTGGGYHTVGLKTDGTVVALGYNFDGQCDVGGWDLN